MVKSRFNCSGFTRCSHSSTLAIVNHTPFSPKVLDAPSSHNSSLDVESAVAPAGPLTCFIHHASNGVIQKAVIFSPNSLLCEQWPCRVWWFTIPVEYLDINILNESRPNNFINNSNTFSAFNHQNTWTPWLQERYDFVPGQGYASIHFLSLATIWPV